MIREKWLSNFLVDCILGASVGTIIAAIWPMHWFGPGVDGIVLTLLGILAGAAGYQYSAAVARAE